MTQLVVPYEGADTVGAVSNGHREPALLGRGRECRALDRVLQRVRAGEGDVLVLRGEPGIGKSALLEHLVGSASGCRIERACGVESESGLGDAALHQLCAGMLDLRERLPAPQRAALAAALGLTADPPGDRLVVGLAVLGLLSEAARERPLVCVVDDAQWLDEASAQIIGFVARRLTTEPVGLVCAARTGIGREVLAGLPEMAVQRLDDRDARSLLVGSLHAPLDAAVCDQVVAESHGNPRALLQLPRTCSAADLAGGFGPPRTGPPACREEQSYSRRLDVLPSETRLLVLAAAAEPLGDPVLLHRAAKGLGVDMAAAEPAVDAGLIRIGARVEFAHPLVRSAAYRSASADDRHRVHHALAHATDAETDADRRAWHRARATTSPDEELAAELERSAGRAATRGGIAAAAAFLGRAVALTMDRGRRGERALAAAQASLEAGAYDTALALVATAEAGALDELQRIRADLLRGHVAFASRFGSDAPQLLLDAARRLETSDPALARETYLTAWGAASIAGDMAGASVHSEICRAARAVAPPVGAPRAPDLLLDGLVRLTTGGYAAAAATLQRAAQAVTDMPVHDVLGWGWMATDAKSLVWDLDGVHALAARHVRLARDAGALAQLPLHLSQLGTATAWTGDFARAASLAAQADSAAAATGSPIVPCTALRLAALRGREAECLELISDARERQGTATIHAHWAAAVLYNGLARYEEAAAAALKATAGTPAPSIPAMYALPELVEAAGRAGNADLARDAHRRLAEMTEHCGSDVAAGLEARCRALVGDDEAAEDPYREALERLSGTRLRPELARAHLLFGEWLRRAGRRVEARAQLRTAHGVLVAIGMEAFAERARRELLATGEKVRRRSVETRDELTPQEEQIARLARGGMSNPEIGTQLFLSPRTVEWHLRKVFTKLGIRSRHELGVALPDGGGALVLAGRARE